MIDYFALLELPRSPWLDPAEVKTRFVQLSASAHPDRLYHADDVTRADATNRYSDLNAAQRCLADPRLRLRHLVELETGQVPPDVGAVPPHISDLFFTVANALRTADELIRRNKRANSPMVKAQMMKKIVGEVESLRGTIGNLERQRCALDEQCKGLADEWNSGSRGTDELTGLHRDYSYLNRWIDQMNERILQLSI